MKVLVVDDHPLVRKGIISILSFEKEIEGIYEASTVSEAMDRLSNEKIDLTLLDLYLGREDGLLIVKQAKEAQLGSRFVVFTSSSRKDDFDRAQKMDVEVYILKDAYTEDFIYAIKVIHRGKRFYDPSLLEYNFLHKEKNNMDELTEREKDVLRELGMGHCNKQIAKNLYISENTVKKHISAILCKMGFSHRTEAALFASQKISIYV